MEIETKAWVWFARTSLVNDGEDENGRDFKTLVYAFELRRHLNQKSKIHIFLAKFVSVFGLKGIRRLLLNQVPSFVLIETGYELKTAKLPGQCPFNRSQRLFWATRRLLSWNEHQSGRARDKVNHLHACMRRGHGMGHTWFAWQSLGLYADPSGSSPLITNLDLFSTVALFQFSLFKSRETNFDYFLQRCSLTCAMQSMKLDAFFMFFCVVPSSRLWPYSIKQRFYHWPIFARKAT